eukprot:6012363-Amphidinium_carterae.2
MFACVWVYALGYPSTWRSHCMFILWIDSTQSANLSQSLDVKPRVKQLGSAEAKSMSNVIVCLFEGLFSRMPPAVWVMLHMPS